MSWILEQDMFSQLFVWFDNEGFFIIKCTFVQVKPSYKIKTLGYMCYQQL